MKFQSGILGVIVVVIALIGTIFGGYILNVHGQSTVSTSYTDVTDVSSLYSYTQQADYIEYNPAKNFTGYQLSNGSGTGINFTQSGIINQYYMGQSSSQSETLNIGSLLSRPSITDNNRLTYAIYDFDANTNTAYALYDYDNYNPQNGICAPLQLDMKGLVTYLKSRAPANTNTIAINIPSNSDLNVSDYYSWGGYNFYLNPAGANFNYAFPLMLWHKVNAVKTSGGQFDTAPQYFSYFRNNQVSLYFDNSQTVDNTTVNVNYNGQYTYSELAQETYWALIGSTSKQLTINNFSSSSRTGTVSNYPYWHGGNYTIEVVYSYDTVYEYMNPSQGVSINNPSNLVTTNWSNNKTNYQANILFGVTGVTNSNTITTPLGDSISVRYTGVTNQVKINSGSWSDIGSWNYFMLSIDGYAGKVTVIPVIDFINYQTYTLANYVYDVGTITKSPFTRLSWLQTSDSYTFSVASTMVEVTNKLFMVDPSLNIKDYFPLTEGYKIELSNFTKLGDSITINNVTYYGDADGNPIQDTGYIYFPTDDGGVSIKLGTMSIIEDSLDGHTYVQSNEFGAERVDLGTTTTSIISATGVWFFTNELFEGNIVDSYEYVWDWVNNLTSTQSIMIWLGLIVVGSVVAHRFFDFKMLDFAIVVASSIILYCVLGVF